MKIQVNLQKRKNAAKIVKLVIEKIDNSKEIQNEGHFRVVVHKNLLVAVCSFYSC